MSQSAYAHEFKAKVVLKVLQWDRRLKIAASGLFHQFEHVEDALELKEVTLQCDSCQEF